MSGIFIKTQAEALLRSGVEVEVIAPVPWVPCGFGRLSQKWREYRSTPERYELGGITVHRPRFLQFPRGDVWTFSHRRVRGTIRRLPHCQGRTLFTPISPILPDWRPSNGPAKQKCLVC